MSRNSHYHDPTGIGRVELKRNKMRKILLICTVAVAGASASAPARAGDGAAIAAGLIGGLALGGLAAAAQPAYAYPVYGYPVYRRVVVNCWRERRRSIDDYGNVYFRRVRVCN
jgi:hypothetical protein